ncbi:ribonuclease III [bacterium]|nr:ribonuclease III [bacterium]
MISLDDVPRQTLLSAFQNRLNLSFLDLRLLDTALTHRSFINETASRENLTHNERLEFLGDAVLGQVVASLLYERLQGRPEGELARIKSIVVSEHTLAPIAAAIGIPEALRMGRGEEISGGRNKKAILADSLEALIGAVFVDSGYEAVQRFVQDLMEPAIAETIRGQSKDYKTIIQEYAQKYLKEMPAYELERSEGPDHARIFWVSCLIAKRRYGPCAGSTKKEAEQIVAQEVYARLKDSSKLAAERLAAIGSLSP